MTPEERIRKLEETDRRMREALASGRLNAPGSHAGRLTHPQGMSAWEIAQREAEHEATAHRARMERLDNETG